MKVSAAVVLATSAACIPLPSLAADPVAQNNPGSHPDQPSAAELEAERRDEFGVWC